MVSRRIVANVVAMLVAVRPAMAQEADWAYKATLYGWFPGMSASLETEFGTVESEVDASDTISSLDMAFMGSLSAQYDRWGVVGDLLYTDLSSSQDTPFGLFGEADIGVKLTAWSAYGLYRVSNGSGVLFDVGAGFRHFDLEVDVGLSRGLLDATSRRADSSWTTPLIAARVLIPVDEDWFLTGFADWGGSGSDDETWQVYGGVGYAFNKTWSTQFGYRHMDISREIDGRDVSVELSGPLLALTYSF